MNNKVHLQAPCKQAPLDFNIGRDIGYNPYPIYSDYWYEYRAIWFRLEKTLDKEVKKGI